MNIKDELRRRGKRPYNLSEEEYNAFYARLRPISTLKSKIGYFALYDVVSAVIEMYRLRQAGYTGIIDTRKGR